MSPSPASKPLILIDGSSYLYRAFHALPALTNSKGEPTGAVYGVMNMIRKLLADYNPQYVAVVFDAKEKTFRDEIYPAYKAHRPSMPDELRGQIQAIHTAITAMGLPLITIPGVEADDVIATLAHTAAQKGWQIVISTGDKDLAQLVDEHITLINTMTNVVLDRKGVTEKFGIPPEKMIDYLTLIGDSVDNIPGVPKVGPKTAVKWLQDYGSLDAIIAHAAEFSGKIGENLRNTLPQLELSRTLVTLKTDIALPYTPEDLQAKPADSAQLINLFQHLEFKSWLKELLENPDGNVQPQTVPEYETVLTENQLDQWLQKLQASASFALAIMNNSTNPLDARLVGIAVAVAPNQAAYIPMAHDYFGAPAQLSRDYVLARFKPLLENPGKTIIGDDMKNIISVFANHELHFKARLFDTMLESYVLDSSGNRHDLNSLTLKYLGKNPLVLTDITGKGAKQLPLAQIDLHEASAYCAQAADYALQVHETLWPKIANDPDLKRILLDIELELLPVLQHMERYGVMIDPKLLANQSHDLAKRIVELETETYHLAGTVFNLSSPKQLQEILYDRLHLPVLSKTPTGAPSTAESVLQELALDYPLPKLILEYRSLTKLKSTYTDSLPRQIHPKTQRIHTCYNQAVTSTGRLSSTDPNLQNIPVRNEEGRRIRQAFIAPPGYKIISADYSQIELRIMAHLSQDASLLSAFAKDLDIHTATAAEVFAVELNQVTAEQRRHAKAINFGLIYGMSAFGLSRQLAIDRNTAQAYIDLYFARYPHVKNYMDSTRELASNQGFVKTLFGRRLFVPDIRSSQMQRRRAAERAAINAPMQGTAADIIKLAMIHLDQHLRTSKLNAKMIMQVHDELVFEVAESDVNQMIEYIREAMIHVVELSVPLAIHVSVGDNWDQAH